MYHTEKLSASQAETESLNTIFSIFFRCYRFTEYRSFLFSKHTLDAVEETASLLVVLLGQ